MYINKEGYHWFQFIHLAEFNEYPMGIEGYLTMKIKYILQDDFVRVECPIYQLKNGNFKIDVYVVSHSKLKEGENYIKNLMKDEIEHFANTIMWDNYDYPAYVIF